MIKTYFIKKTKMIIVWVILGDFTYVFAIIII